MDCDCSGAMYKLMDKHMPHKQLNLKVLLNVMTLNSATYIWYIKKEADNKSNYCMEIKSTP